MPRATALLDRPADWFRPQHALSAAVVLPLLLAVPLLVVLLVVRRASGALVQPLSPAALVACGLLLGIWAVAAHEWMSASGVRKGAFWRSPRAWMPPVVLLLACYALLLPGSSALGAAGLMALLAGAEATAWKLARRGKLPEPRQVIGLSAPQRSPGGTAIETQADGIATSAAESTENVIGEMVRRREADGCEAIRGWVQADLAAGQRTAPVHVAFCPALAGMPNCEAEQVAGPPATIRVAQVLPYGARFDVKLDAPAPGPVTVRIEFSATAAADFERSE